MSAESIEGRGATSGKRRIPVEALDNYDVHPAAELFPLINDDQLLELAQDIRENGQQEPIWMYQGQLLDGRNRAVACAIAGRTPLSQEWHPKAGETPATFVMSRNVHRRHLTASQRATLAVRLSKVIASEREERKRSAASALVSPFSTAQPTPPPTTPRRGAPPTAVTPFAAPGSTDMDAATPPAPRPQQAPPVPAPFSTQSAAETGEKVRQGRVREQAAASMGVSTGYVNDAANLEKADPEMFDRVMKGEVSIPEAQKQVVARHQELGTLSDLKLRPGAIKAAMKALDEENQTRRPEPPSPPIRLPKASKVVSSRSTLQITVTFGNGEVAEEWLNKMRVDKRVLNLKYEEVDNPPATRRRRT